MNQLQRLFEYEGKQIRTVIRGGEPWFVAKDICVILEHSNPSKAIKDLVDEDDLTTGYPIVDSLGRTQNATLVNESGLYSLILGSRKQEAKKFKRWITNEVLPAIRKTGGYVADDELFIQTYLPYADEQTKATFRATLALVRKQNEQIAAMKPKAEYFDALVDRNLLTNFRDTAKELHIRQTDFINWLLEKKFIYRDQKGRLKPYAQYVPELFQLKEWAKNDKADVQTLITSKGRETFRLLYDGKRKIPAS